MSFFECVGSSTWFYLLFGIVFIILGICLAVCWMKIQKLKEEYKKLMQIIGKGEDFNEVLRKYLTKVEYVSRETEKLNDKVESLEKNVEKCVQKVGVVRYNAYGKVGSDLCFAVALLDFEDNGVVLNGIYSRDNTTMTYAKPIEHGKSKYTLVKEEEEALEIAKHSGYKCYLEFNQKENSKNK